MQSTLQRTAMERLVAVMRELKTKDKHNQTLAILLLLGLTELSKRVEGLRRLKAYTFWNLTACLVNFSFRMNWQRPLFTNSLAILACYRTASADDDAHHELQKRSGLDPWRYFIGDQIVHLLPTVFVGGYLIKHGMRVRPQHGGFSLLGMIHFSYSQAGMLDMGGLYAPHDSHMAWTAAVLAHLLGPYIINNAIDKNYRTSLNLLGIVFIPYFLKRLGVRPKAVDHARDFHMSLMEEEEPFKICIKCERNLCDDCKFEYQGFRQCESYVELDKLDHKINGL